MNNKDLCSNLLDTYELLLEKQNKLDDLIDMLGAERNEDYLQEAFNKLSLAIVLAWGGTSHHFSILHDREIFLDFEMGKMERAELERNLSQIILSK